MKIENTPLKDCFILHGDTHRDSRGYFIQIFNEGEFEKKTGLKINFIQDNLSSSSRGVLRGLHLQKGQYSQSKLVKVISGEVLDVVVDLRKDSPSFGKHFSIILSEENNKQLFIPAGFAHGFIVLSETAMFYYKVDNYYNLKSEVGIIYNDFKLKIDWLLKPDEILISDRDKSYGTFDDYVSNI
jgi:dTDP-4-dehydrorhamnose 3,5-epimerase